METKFSFILPCYNIGRYIAGCLDSLYAQDIPETEYEVICVNDCSTTENLTAGGARNTGIEASKGEFIWFVDPDDAIKPNCLQELYAKALETGVDILFFNYDDADENLVVRREDKTYPDSEVCRGQEYVLKYFKNKFATFGIIWREIYRAGFLRETGIRYPIMRKAQDVVFLWKVMLRAERVCSVISRRICSGAPGGAPTRTWSSFRRCLPKKGDGITARCCSTRMPWRWPGPS